MTLEGKPTHFGIQDERLACKLPRRFYESWKHNRNIIFGRMMCRTDPGLRGYRQVTDAYLAALARALAAWLPDVCVLVE